MFTSYYFCIDKKQPEQSGGKKRPATDGLSRISRCKKSKTNSDKENDLLLAKAQVYYNVVCERSSSMIDIIIICTLMLCYGYSLAKQPHTDLQ